MTTPSSSSPGTPRLDALLADIHVLEAEYRGYGPPPTADVLAAARDARSARADARTSHPGPGALAGRSESEQARHELNLAATLVLHQRAAADQLSGMTTQEYLDPGSALVLACLMQLSGRHLAARFWLTFAAGGGDPEAAYCLCLAHRAAAEFQDADHWRREAARLRRENTPSAMRHSRVGAPPQLARELRSLLAQCHRGKNPRLSKSLETTIRHLGITENDEFPVTTPRTAHELIRALVPLS